MAIETIEQMTKYADMLLKAMDYRENYEEKVGEAAAYIARFVSLQPAFGLTLGSGLGGLASKIENATVLDYSKIPNFPTPTVEGHEGKMIIGKLEGVPVIGLKGRKHFYEVANDLFGTGILQVVFAVNVLANLGIENYFATNAVGGLNPNYKTGDVMVVKSHINLIPNPLMGRHLDFETVDCEKTLRFPPMNDAYHPMLRDLLLSAGQGFKENMHEGVLVSVTGPSYESEGESVALRDGWKADVVGMSVIPEVIAARNRGMRCVAISCVTNTITKEGTNAASHGEVQAVLDSKEVKERLESMVGGFFRRYNEIYWSGKSSLE